MKRSRVLPFQKDEDGTRKDEKDLSPSSFILHVTSFRSAPRLGRKRRRQISRSAAQSLLWSLGLFGAIQLALSVGMDTVHPEWRDPEFGTKWASLQSICAENPTRPQVLILGSSRALLGVHPEILAGGKMARGQGPLVFNFAMTGSGPVQELLCLRRLLARGVRPRCVFVEVLPPLLDMASITGQTQFVEAYRLSWPDLSLLRRYCNRPTDLYRRWLETRLTPCFSHRFCLLSRYAPMWLALDPRYSGWSGGSRFGWLPYGHRSVPPEQSRQAVARAHDEYYACLQQFQIDRRPDAALRELIGLCQARHIAVALFLMPEGSEFRSWYPPTARALLASYLGGISRDQGIPVVDMRTWMPDSDFVDAHHLLPDAADAFTLRFEREVLSPFLTGLPLEDQQYEPPKGISGPTAKGPREESYRRAGFLCELFFPSPKVQASGACSRR